MRPDYGYFEETHLGKSQDARLFKRLFAFVRPYRRMLAGSIGLVLLITALDLALPYATKIAIDRYIVPAAPAASAQRTSPPSYETRYLQVDTADPAIKKIVHKYSRLFSAKGPTARIAYADLAQIEKQDLMQLRKNNIRGLGVVAAIFLTLVLLNFIFNFIQKMIMEITGHQIMHDLRMVLFNHIQGLSMPFLPVIRSAAWSPGQPTTCRTCTSCSLRSSP
jgi:ATP-binding cassette subfamily B protein